MGGIATLKDLDVKGKRILLRVDLNVPMAHGKIADDTRLIRVLPTIEYLAKKGAKVIILSHFGRPKGTFTPSMSLAPLTDYLSKYLKREVKFGVDCVGPAAEEAVGNLQNGEIILMENLRFHEGEEKNLKAFADNLAKLGEAYVNDAFSCSHRAHASIVGLAERLPSAAGFLLEDEVMNLEKHLSNPKKPSVAIVGGSKISTKLELLNSLIEKVNLVAIGGGMANTFLAAKGYNIGKSLHEKDLVQTAHDIMKKAEIKGCDIFLPSDVITASSLENNPECDVISIENVPDDKMILDLGPNTIRDLTRKLESHKTIIWNGPLGAFEYSPFDVGTISMARAIAGFTKSGNAVSIAGGGDVLAAIAKSGLSHGFTYISTAGGAFLEWLEGKELPGIAVLWK